MITESLLRETAFWEEPGEVICLSCGEVEDGGEVCSACGGIALISPGLALLVLANVQREEE